MKQYTYKGKSLEELKKMNLDDFIKLVPARQRRSLARKLTDQQKILLKKNSFTGVGLKLENHDFFDFFKKK